MSVRDLSKKDLQNIRLIYNEGIVDRIATLDEEEKDEEAIGIWFAKHGHPYSVMVAEEEDEVVGFASLNQFNPRKAYDHVADLSIYIKRSWRGRGVGGQLLVALIQQAQQNGFHKIVLATFPRNIAGQRLYRKHGFVEVGVYKEHGRVDGSWQDIMIMEKLLD